MTNFKEHWRQGWRDIGVAQPNMALCDELMARYSEPHRHYHTLQHLEECLSLFASLRDLAAHPAELEIALWFHDAIYDVKRDDNEALCAEWA